MKKLKAEYRIPIGCVECSIDRVKKIKRLLFEDNWVKDHHTIEPVTTAHKFAKSHGGKCRHYRDKEGKWRWEVKHVTTFHHLVYYKESVD